MVPSNYSFFQYCDNNICLFASFSYRSSDVVTAKDVALNLFYFLLLIVIDKDFIKVIIEKKKKYKEFKQKRIKVRKKAYKMDR